MIDCLSLSLSRRQIDCEDFSDEFNCKLITLKEGYLKVFEGSYLI